MPIPGTYDLFCTYNLIYVNKHLPGDISMRLNMQKLKTLALFKLMQSMP